MLNKFIVIAALLLIIYTLTSSFYYLIRDKGKGKRTVRRLSWRVGLSFLLFTLIFMAMATGWIRPSGSGPIQYPVPEQVP
ncbi:MAG: hypothetical protein ACI9CB_000999 [Rhodothermales bacterium]|jgi:hypothetical protein